MKLIFALLALAVFTSSASAFGVNVGQLLATKQSGVINQQDLQYIIQSQYNEYQIIHAFWTQGDLNKDGQLSQQEFAAAYTSFIYFLIGQQIGQEFLYARFELASFNPNANSIDLAEFTFLVVLDLRFIYNNYNLFNGHLSVLSASVQKLEGFLNGQNQNSIIQAVFFGFDYDKNNIIAPAEFRSGFRILGYILGVNLSYTSQLLNDLYALADTNGDNQLSGAEANAFVASHLTAITGVFNAIAGN